MEFNLTAKKTFFIFSFITLSLFILDIASYFDYISTNKFFYEFYDEYLNITYETNIPTMFSFLISFFTGVSALLIYKEDKRFGWIVVGLFFIYLGLDDALQIHEYLGSYFGDIFLKNGFISYYWQVFFMPFFALVGLYIFYFLVSTFKKEDCYKCIIAIFIGFGCYALAVGLDYYEGLEPNFNYIMDRTDYFSYRDITHVLRAVEEAIEMFGATLIFSAILWLKSLKISIA